MAAVAGPGPSAAGYSCRGRSARIVMTSLPSRRAKSAKYLYLVFSRTYSSLDLSDVTAAALLAIFEGTYLGLRAVGLSCSKFSFYNQLTQSP